MADSDAAKLLELTAKTERAVLSALTYDAKFRAAWQPEPDLFSSPATKALAVAIARCQRAGWDGDDQQVALELRRDDALKHFAGGAEGVSEILVGTPAVLDPWVELDLLRELKALRALRHALQDAVRAAETTCDLASVRALVSEATAASYAGTGHEGRDLQQVFADTLTTSSNPKLRRRGTRTGIPQLDAATGGLRALDFWTVAAKGNFGKSALALNFADREVAAGGRVGIVSVEDGEALYANRWLARRTGVKAYKFRDHALEPEDIQRASEVVEHARGWGVFVDGIGRSVESIAADVRSLSVTLGITLWLFDYLQRFICAAKLENERLRIRYIEQCLNNATKQAGCAAVLFSQVTEDKNGRPHIRDSEDVRNDSTVVLLGYTESEAELNSAGSKTGTLERKFLILDKVKDGPHGFPVELQWEPELAAFQRDERIYRPAQDWHDDN